MPSPDESDWGGQMLSYLLAVDDQLGAASARPESDRLSVRQLARAGAASRYLDLHDVGALLVSLLDTGDAAAAVAGQRWRRLVPDRARLIRAAEHKQRLSPDDFN